MLGELANMATVLAMPAIGFRGKCDGMAFFSSRFKVDLRRRVRARRDEAGDQDFPAIEMRKDGRFFLENDVQFSESEDSEPEPSFPRGKSSSRSAEPGKASRGGAEPGKASLRSAEQGKASLRSAESSSRTAEPRMASSRNAEPRMTSLRSAGVKDESRMSPREARIREKKPPLQEQVYLPSMLRDPHVAIVGGGMSGLICALTLEERGIRSTVFDTGKHGLGGRMGTRHIVQEQKKEPMIFDHAAQYFTVQDLKFRNLVERWISEGAVTEWEGAVGLLREGHFTELPHSTKYVATHGMRALADHMISKARLVTVDRPCWISSMEPVNGRWYLTENGLGHGNFDAVIIAHNGKCANRLLARSGAPLVAKQMKRLDLSSIWALLAAFDEPLPQPASFEGAFVEGVNSLSWMGNNSRKLRSGQAPHCWTFFSTAAYGKKHKVPQESIPRVKAERVTREMLRGAEMALGLPEGSLPTPVYTRVQLWGAALPTNSPGVPCIFDPHSRVGICGDWLLGASLEAAALSGMALAHHVAEFCEKAEAGYFKDDVKKLNEFSAGLTTPLLSLDGHDIGQFPGTSTPQKQDIKGRALAVK